MMAGNPNWWSMNSMHPQSHQHQQFPSTTTFHSPAPPPPPLPPQYNLYGGSSSPLSANSLSDHHPNQDFPRSWRQLLLGGLANEQERFVGSPFQNKKLENWEDQTLNPSLRVPVSDVKQEVALSTSVLFGAAADEEFQASTRPSWSQVVQASSPTSCVTSLSSNLLNFSSSKAEGRNQNPENSSECNSSIAGGVSKKPRIQHSTAQPALKTDTASVLSEAIGYIRFLQAQIEALSSPYLGNVSGGSGSMGQGHQQQSVVQDRPKDLKSRGLCLVPISCTQHVGSDNGADYWAPALGGGF
ncbi:transcription factor bHLH68-like isoform X2 [Coffea eugenioides]|uniref:transcription factor bHLH68-like isoform X2 n=1 Tax=Coffea eugenioides TaxID=49369 RepID=UPI000F607062|nr:transcription factor bHLH68-like isoform X2 [Coffea eugenioides]